MTKTQEKLIKLASRPASSSFKPAPYKLVEVVHTRGDEYSTNDTPKPYNNQRFDQWHKGDLVVVERITRAYYQKGAPTSSSKWYIGRRGTTPSAVRHTIELNNCYRLEIGRDTKLWRIVLRYLAAAEKLVNVEFDTREELEAALDNPSLAFAKDAA